MVIKVYCIQRKYMLGSQTGIVNAEFSLFLP